MNEDDLVLKKYIVELHHLPKGVLLNLGWDTNTWDLMLAPFHGRLFRKTFGYAFEFESQAHYTWFIMRWS